MNERMVFSLWVLAALGGTLSLAVVCYTILIVKGFQRAGGGSAALNSLTTRDGGLQFVTVVMVVAGAFVLRVNELISPDAFMSIASGVLGYVLGKSGRNNAKRSGVRDDAQPQSN